MHSLLPRWVQKRVRFALETLRKSVHDMINWSPRDCRLNTTFHQSLLCIIGPRIVLTPATPPQPVLLVTTGEATDRSMRTIYLRLHFLGKASGTQNIIRLLEDAEAEVIVIQSGAEMAVD